VLLDERARDAAAQVAEAIGGAIDGPFLPAAPGERRQKSELLQRRWDSSTSAERADLLSVQRQWLKLARSHEAKTRAPSPRKSYRKDGD
jgi:hypothetical protein